MKDEIFENFFEKLSEDDEFPDEAVEELKDLRESNDLTSEERILSALEAGESNGED